MSRPPAPEPPANAPSLYRENVPWRFWRLCGQVEPTPDEWSRAVRAAAIDLPSAARAGGDDVESLLYHTLGEGQFGPGHFRLSPAKRLYYAVKPVLPRSLSRSLRRLYHRSSDRSSTLGWPIEARYARFQWRIVRELLKVTGQPGFRYIDFWPQGRPYAFALTHDVETADGQALARAVADLDARHGFRSSFNFVPERYRLDRRLIDELAGRGFEIGVHGLKHDGNLFRSYDDFMRQAERINRYLREFGAVGFRAPLTHRHPAWMQALEIEYDSSFFDTDPYEAVAGGTMSLWPFTMGRFLELPYTLAQDYTLTAMLKETTPRIWLKKVDFIWRYSGLALICAHPDYLRSPQNWAMYEEFLQAMSSRADFWHALPRDVARWWRARATAASAATLAGGVVQTIVDPEVQELKALRNVARAG